MFKALTRIAKTCMVIFNSGAVGAAARILSTIPLKTVLYSGDEVVNVRQKLLNSQL